MNDKRKVVDNLFWVSLVLVSVIFCFARTMEDSLRFDEAMEYLISGTSYSKMNPFIQSTYQPPLYNYIIHIWLMISPSTIWFKVFNIVCYGFGTIGLLKILKVIDASKLSMFFAILCQGAFSGLIYYSQICGEYVIALAVIYWIVYTMVKMIKQPSWKTIIIYVLFATVGIYSQYGVAITIVGTGIVAVIALLAKKEIKNIIRLIIAGAFSSVFFVAPLYYFFVKVQTANQAVEHVKPSIESMIEGMRMSVKFSLFAWHNDYQEKIYRVLLIAVILIAVLFICDMILSLCRKERKRLNTDSLILYLLVVVSFVIYLPAVDSKIYAYGNYESRHTTLVMPLMVILISVVISTISKRMSCNVLKVCTNIVMLGTLGMFIFNSFDYNLIQHWNYDQIDAGIQAIHDYREKHGDVPVWVNYYAVPSYMIYENDNALQDFADCYMQGENWERDGVFYSVSSNLVSDYNEEFPDEFIGFYSDDFYTMYDTTTILKEYGYQDEVLHENIFSSMAPGTRVVKYSIQK